MSDIDVERMKVAFATLASIEIPARRPAETAARDSAV